MTAPADVLARPKVGPTDRVTADEFRRRAGLAGWDPKTIRMFAVSPPGFARAYVGRRWLTIEPTPFERLR